MAALPDSAADATISHQLALIRYSNGAVQRIIAALNKADARILVQLAEIMERAPASASAERLSKLLDAIRELNVEAYAELRRRLGAEMADVAGNEAEWTGRLYKAVPELGETFAVIGAEQAYAAALARPFQGRLLKEWAQSIGETRMVRIRDTVRMGFLEGQTTGQIVSTLRGTRAAGYADGLLEIDRRHAESVVRTALSHTANVARQKTFDANAELLGSLMWISTLDGRTSQPCRARDHKRYSIETHKPIGHSLKWEGGPGRLHWCCRSTFIALLKGQTQLFGTRSSDSGQVDANLSYGGWLRRQPADVQDDVLGPTRAKLFRQGGLDIEAFSNNKGQVLTLAELRERDAVDFQRLGLAA